MVLYLACACTGCADRVDSGAPVANLPDDPWVAPANASDPRSALFASCASCHMADGGGRSDGTVPRLAGQRATIVASKLQKLQSGATFLPVMLPFARALTAAESQSVADYVAGLPVPRHAARTDEGAQDYAALCATCHGARGEGSDTLLAPRLCGQHAAYLERRMDEIVANVRGDADPAMAAIVGPVPPATRATIAGWLAGAACEPEVGS